MDNARGRGDGSVCGRQGWSVRGMFLRSFARRLGAAGVGLFLFFLPSASHAAEPENGGPAEFIFGVRIGDAYESILLQQGWYACDVGERKSVCFDEVEVGDQIGTFRIGMLDGRALYGEFTPNRADSFWEIVGSSGFSHQNEDVPVHLVTRNVTIDIIKAVHDLGEEEAKRRFSGYLAKDNQSLQAISFVASRATKLPRPGAAFPNGDAYLNSLPAGMFLVSVSRAGNVTTVMIYPTLASASAAFPQYCRDGCKSWSPPDQR